LLPGLIVIASRQTRNILPASASLFSALAITAFQPDLSQALALGAAMMVILAHGKAGPRAQLAAVIAIMGLLAIAWLKPDPLDPVPVVEGIVGLLWAQAPAMAAFAVASLFLACLTPLMASVTPQSRIAGRALTAYFLVTAAAPLIGNFPVPLVGLTMSPILGFWIGVGLITAPGRGS
ncbi:MAG: hypothetical protein WA979_10505, partial [Pacificimonas sp.]